ncbi:hypothetical protein YC2023_032382 [Brassica napus]
MEEKIMDRFCDTSDRLNRLGFVILLMPNLMQSTSSPCGLHLICYLPKWNPFKKTKPTINKSIIVTSNTSSSLIEDHRNSDLINPLLNNQFSTPLDRNPLNELTSSASALRSKGSSQAELPGETIHCNQNLNPQGEAAILLSRESVLLANA